MYRSETVARGWVIIKGYEADPAAEFHVTTIPWRQGLAEIGVFGIDHEGRTGAASQVGEAFTYR